VADFAVIVVNYNTAILTGQTIRSFCQYHKEKDFELIVVDNNSHEDDLKKLREATKDLPKNFRLIESKTNLGFGRANNLAVSETQAKYLFFLNSDTITTEPLLPAFKECFEQNFKVGALAPTLYEDGERQAHAYGKFPTLLRLLRRSHDEILTETADHRQVGWISGAAFAIRKDIFERVGGFGDEYFMYFEDIDLCKKVALDGYESWVLKNIALTHLRGKSLKLSKDRRQLYFKSQDIFFKKYYGCISSTLLKIFRLPYLLFIN
jgi:GT2 family glycosyltransferase